MAGILQSNMICNKYWNSGGQEYEVLHILLGFPFFWLQKQRECSTIQYKM